MALVVIASSSGGLVADCHMPRRVSRCCIGLIRFVSSAPITESQRALSIRLPFSICGATKIARGSLREGIYCNDREPRSTAATCFACGPT
jgi:hypothetical protein